MRKTSVRVQESSLLAVFDTFLVLHSTVCPCSVSFGLQLSVTSVDCETSAFYLPVKSHVGGHRLIGFSTLSCVRPPHCACSKHEERFLAIALAHGDLKLD
mmetsp:Transcript_24429/g.60626  ORF Transcript_24429/g.60626 Transcript_24429/m.60626 type:complete len:100 (+) Transcript_24429:2346-2645(+)